MSSNDYMWKNFPYSIISVSVCMCVCVPSSWLDLLDMGSEGLWPLASWTESHWFGFRPESVRDAVDILPYTEQGCWKHTHTLGSC